MNSNIIEFETQQCNALQIVFETLKDLVGEANFMFDPSGIYLSVFDISRSIRIQMNLPHDRFDHFFVDTSRLEDDSVALNVGMSIQNLKTIFKSLGNNKSILSAHIKNSDISILNMRFDINDKKRIIEYELNLIDLNDIQSDELDKIINYDFEIQMPSKSLKEICNTISKVNASYMDITYCQNESNESVIMFSSGGDDKLLGMKCSVKIKPDIVKISSDYNNTNTINKTFRQRFNLEKIKSIVKCTKLCDTVSICINHDTPMTFKYIIADLGDIFFCISPCDILT